METGEREGKEEASRDLTAVDVLRAPVRFKRPPRRTAVPSGNPLFDTERKSKKQREPVDFSPVFWKVVREIRLEEKANITITELEPSPRGDVAGRKEASKWIDYSDSELASGETSSSDHEDTPKVENVREVGIDISRNNVEPAEELPIDDEDLELSELSLDDD